MSSEQQTAPNETTAPALHAIFTHDVLVGERLRLYAFARFIVIAVIVAASVLAVRVFGVTGLHLGALLGLAGVMTLYNSAGLYLAQHDAVREPTELAVTRGKRLLAGLVVLDFLALTFCVWAVGGARSPLLGFYLFHLVVSAFLLPKLSALLVALLAIVLLDGMVLLELSGGARPGSPSGATPGEGALTQGYAVMVIGVYSTLFVLISLSATSLVARLRKTERELTIKKIELEKLSALRRQFLLLAMHNMNSPLAAVTMLLRNLVSGAAGTLDRGPRAQVERALARLDGMVEFLADMRRLGEVEHPDLHDHSTQVGLGFLLGEVIDEHQELAERKGQSLSMDLEGPAGIVFGQPRLLREALVNYVTNAIKYTPEGGRIVGRIVRVKNAVRAEVTDDGIGITEAHTAKLFEEFVRVDRSNPATRHEKGTGLGLALVRRIAEAHGGRVGVVSTPGEGSTFWIELPEP